MIEVWDHGGGFRNGLQGSVRLPLAPLVAGQPVGGRRLLEGGRSTAHAELVLDMSFRPYF